MNVQVRPATPEDEPFLIRLLADTIVLDLHAGGWPEALKAQIIPLQASARLTSVRRNFAGGESRIVLRDGEAAGWFYYAALSEEVRLVEVLIVERYWGQGLGTAAVRHAIAASAGKPVRLHVHTLNERAIRLYTQAGFRRIGGDAVQHLMEHAGQATC